MGISEAERRVKELTALITNQLRLIRKLEKRGGDLTSAKIVFDSLRVSLFLATQDWHRARCQIGSGPDSAFWASKPSLAVVPYTERRMARWTGGEASTMAEGDLPNLTDNMGTKEELGASVVPEIKAEQKNDSSDGNFEFRLLTEEEKKEFVNSLNSDGKRILDQLAGKVTRSGESAA